MSEKFRTSLERVVIYSNHGSAMANDYSNTNDDNGRRRLVKSGEFSLYDKIQASRNSCDLKVLLERYKLTGDPSILERKKGFYADVLGIPDNYADVLRLVNAANDIFSSLSVDERELFNNNPDEFLAALGTKKAENVLNNSDIIEKEVVSNE